MRNARMPPTLCKAPPGLDKAVDAAYGYKDTKDDAPRVAFLFARYQELTGTAPQVEPSAETENGAETPKPKRQPRKKA